MTRAFIGTAIAVALLGSAAAYAAETPAAGGSTPATTTDTTATPPASLHCKAPKVPTQVTGKNGKVTWKCQKPAATAPATPQ
jgi:hypothetical protein